ncbi:MAG: endonuclease/exonuclease/phosphatase family protein [Polyangiaceae bacterium]|nr:endonuclease/exonuclease/phosphatase family protein [Polyangiaceae bacterium]
MSRTTPTRLLFALGAAAALAGCSSTPDEPEPPPGPPVPFRALTFNVLCSFCGLDAYDTWDERLVAFEDLFARHDPDLLGLQELALRPEVQQILAVLPDAYAPVFYQAPESVFAYPDASVFYRTSRFELAASGFYWLSPTPDVPSSTGFAPQQVPRLVAWTVLRDLASRRQLYFASTHFDNNAPSQELSAPLAVERTTPWLADVPGMLVGDFNSKPATAAYATLTDAFDDAQALADEWHVASNQAPVPAYDLAERIDHLFLGARAGSAPWQVSSWVVDLFVYGAEDRYPSDHFAIAADLTAPY